MALKNSDLIKYALYSTMSSIGLSMTMSYLTMFQTEGLGWTAALAATVLIIPRIIDFAASAVCGSIIAKTNMKWGKYRSWFVIGGWMVSLGVIMMFFNSRGLPLALQIGIAALGYVFQNLPMSFIQTSQFGLMAVMGGTNMDDRIRLSVASMRFRYVGTILISVGIVPALAALTRVFGASPNPNWYHPNAYMVLGIITSLFFMIGCHFASSAAKDYDRAETSGGSSSLTLREILKGVVTNDQLLIYVLVNTISSISMLTILPLGLFYFMYVLQNMMLQPISATVSTLFGLVAAMIGPAIGKKLGKKRAMQIGMTVSIIDAILIALLAGNSRVVAGNLPLGFLIYVALTCITMIGTNLYLGFGGNYLVDASEYGYWKTGKDNRPAAMGLGAIPVKIAFIVGGAVGGYALHAIGYRPGMGVPGGPPLPENFSRSFMLLLGGLPAAINALGLLIFTFGYKITDADAARYAKENLERSERAAESAPPA